MNKNWHLNYSAGQRFGKLTTLRAFRSDQWWFECVCDCGKNVSVRKKNLVSGQQVSCGCYRATKTLTHGMTHTSEYKSWQMMRDRCLNKNSPSWKWYGKKGITVCEQWASSFENFFEDMGKKPAVGMSIERKNGGGNYEPKNCIWADCLVQSNNLSSNRRISDDGKNLTVAQWGRERGINSNTIRGRLHRGWNELKAISLWEVV